MSALVVVSVVTQKIVERIRAAFPQLDGNLVSLAAIVVGVGLAWLTGASVAEIGFAAPSAVADRIMAGLVAGLGAGVIADLTGRSG